MERFVAAEPLPSGQQHVLRHGDQEAVVVEVGGGVRSYTVGGRDVLFPYAPDEIAEGARGQTLIPWPNRLADGRYSFGGTTFEVPLSEPSQRNALHGFVRWASWQEAGSSESSVALVHRLHAREWYPFMLDLRNEFVLGDDGLTVTTTALNSGATPLPYAVGFHPYLTVGTPRIDDAELQVPASSYVTTDERQLPTGRAPVAGSPYDFRTFRPVGDVAIDYAFGDLDRDADGKAWLHLRDPRDGWTASFWIDEGYHYYELFTGEGLRSARQCLGVEPMSCPPNGLGSGTEVVTIAPGESVVHRWGVTAGPGPVG